VIAGGFSVNTIAAQAQLELDLRSEGTEELAILCTQVEKLVEQSQRPNLQISAQLIGDRPAGELPATHPLVVLASHSLEAVGLTPALNIGSTDANIPLSLGLPAVCIGLTAGSGAHTLKEYILTHPLSQGLLQVLIIVERGFKDLARVS
jgi:acetylornithine deacetylase/succinyl-diaminopimelate desuccinylase-like protein